MFSADISSSAHIDNRKRDILIFDKGPLQWLGNTTLTAEKLYAINFSEQLKNICIIMEQIHEVISEVNSVPLWFGNVLKKTRLYDFSVDFDCSDVADFFGY